jgi:hypothetical protein
MRTSKSSVFLFTSFSTSGAYRKNFHRMWPHWVAFSWQSL